MKKLLFGLLSLASLSAFSQTINCSFVNDPSQVVLKVLTTKTDKDEVRFIGIPYSFLALPYVMTIVENNSHVGYKSQWINRDEDSQRINQVVTINFDLKSKPTTGKLMLASEKLTLDLVCF